MTREVNLQPVLHFNEKFCKMQIENPAQPRASKIMTDNDKAASSQMQELIKKAEAELLSSQDSQYPDEGFESRVQARITALYECKSLIAHAEAQHAERVRGLLVAAKELMDEAIKMAATARSGVNINGHKLSESDWDEWIAKCRKAGTALAEHRAEDANA